MKRNRQTANASHYTTRPISTLIGMAMLALFTAGAAQAAQRAVTDVQYVKLPGEGVRITLTLSGPAPKPKTFTVNHPARLSMDLPNTVLAIKQHWREVDIGSIRSIALADGEHRTRLVVRMTQLVPYETNVSGNTITINLGGAQAASAVRNQSQFSNTYLAQSADKPVGITDVDFRRTETGGGRITVTLANQQVPVDVSTVGGDLVARFPHTRLPKALEQRLDVIDFATPVKYIDAVNKPAGARIRITPLDDANFDQIAYQTNDQFVIELQPITAAERHQRERNKEQYNGKHISLSFQNVDIRSLLQIIAEVADVNMVVSESVSGTMALQLENVPWDQALDIILSSEGLGMRRRGNVIMVAPLQEIAQREKNELKAQTATRNLAPLTSALIQVNYAKAANIALLLESGATSLISERGSIAVDPRTNTLLIRETRTNLRDIRRIINQLDVPVRQVLIETRIVVANRDFAKNLGVQASATDFGSFESPSNGNYQTQTGFTIGLPIAAPSGILSTSILGNTFSLNLELSAMESENRGRIISAPRVITTSGQKARIEQGQEVPYLEAASSGAATVSFKKAVLSLTVTPRITPNNRVIMDLTVTQDSIGDSVSVQGGGSVPAIDTRTLTTRLMVESGNTVVLGGIYQKTKQDAVSKVPVLGDIPLLGALFRSTREQHGKTELLIFVTPTILQQELGFE